MALELYKKLTMNHAIVEMPTTPSHQPAGPQPMTKMEVYTFCSEVIHRRSVYPHNSSNQEMLIEIPILGELKTSGNHVWSV